MSIILSISLSVLVGMGLAGKQPVKTNSKLTMYWVAYESDFSGEKTAKLETCDGELMTMVTPEFWESANLEGTGILTDGRVFNLGANTGCFMWLDPKVTPYGINHKGWGLIPYVSIAANLENDGLPAGTKVYIPAFEGIELPMTNGQKHNGCFRVDDVAWSFAEGANHIDWFVAKKSNYQILQSGCHGHQCQGSEIDIYIDEDCELIAYLPGSVITKIPDPESDCQELWTQCGGSIDENGGKFKGSACCKLGECQVMHKDWSQCRIGVCPDGWECTGPTPKPTSRFPTNKPTLNGNAKPSIIFRLDDVQDYYLSANVKEIIQAFMDRNIPLSIGVIGGTYYGTDASLHKKILEAVNDYGMEVFNHGDDASTFFNAIGEAEAKEHIANGEEADFKVYKSFVPHQNRWNEDTLAALESLGYWAVSASKGGAFPMPVRLQGKLKLMPQHTETAEYAGGNWDSTIANVMTDCTAAVAEDGFCVVMMHPQEFAKETVTVAELGNLLDEVKEKTNWDVTTFRKFARAVEPRGEPTPEPTPTPTDVNKFYPNWQKGGCLNDGNEPAWTSVMFDSLEACCTANFNWKVAECMNGATPEPTATPKPTKNAKTSKPTVKPTMERLETPSPTVGGDDVFEAYKTFCAGFKEGQKRKCKKPCAWKKNTCVPKAQGKVRCKKMPKGSAICEVLGCEIRKNGKCTGKIDWTA